MPQHDVGGRTLRAFLEALGRDAPAPGGGSAAAVAAAMGASLVRMLALLTLGKPKYADHEPLLRAVAEQAAEEQETLVRLAESDASAYDAVLEAYALPQATDEERAGRTQAIQDGLKQACEVPLEVMEHCLEVIGLARNAVTRGSRDAAPDGAAGAELARAALKVSATNVQANLESIDDDAYREAANGRIEEMMYMGVNAANAVDAFVRDLTTEGGAGVSP